MSNTTDMNTETDEKNITSIIKEETGLTIAPPRRKRVLKKAAEPSMKEAVELAGFMVVTTYYSQVHFVFCSTQYED